MSMGRLRDMKYLSLFSGAGGGDLACQHLLGWECIGYVEWEEYCQKVIAQRIADGYLSKAPIYGDIRKFIQSGAAREYRGFADVVTGGFPCQPFSHAGKQLGADDDRNMWPATVDVIRLVRPTSVFLENVSGLVSSGYIFTVCDDLRAAGYQVLPPLRLSASDLGANHKRERLWIVAHANSDGLEAQRERGCTKPRFFPKFAGSHRRKTTPRICGGADDVADWVDRIKALGNGQVPEVAAAAWRLLTT